MAKRKYGKKGVVQKRRFDVWNYKKEIIGVFVVAFLAFLSISLLSYSATDNSWFYFSSTNKVVANWCGVVGAHVAALFFFLFGSGVFVFLLCLCPLATFLFWPGMFPDRPLLRLSMLPAFFLVSTLLFRIHRIDFVQGEPGGLIGRFLEVIIVAIFGRTGSLLLLYALTWICFLIIAQVSLLSFASTIGSLAMVAGRAGVRVGVSLTQLSWALLCRAGAFFYMLAGAIKHLFAKKLPLYVAREKIVLPGKAGEVSKDDQLLRELRSLAGNRHGACQATGPIAGGIIPLATVQDEPKALPEKEALPESKPVASSGPTTGGFTPQISYDLPDFSEFQESRNSSVNHAAFERKCRERGKKLEEKLLHFGVKGKVTAIRPGPVITLFEYQPEIDTKISKIISLEDDLAMALTALSIRIIAPIPGRNVVGFEISNQTRKDVFLADVLAGSSDDSCALPLAFGVDITGNAVVQDLAKMPHVLVAGSTGSGKSVGLNAMLVSLLCQLTPDKLKIILIDPKRLEFAPYADIPHLLFPIVTNPRKAIPVLKWVVQEMEDRYDLMAKVGARSIFDYHKVCKERGLSDELPNMPFIVLIIDELADLMMVAGKDVETQIARTAQMARAAGIHMILATQRPSVDVLTGIIKVNFPARMAFRVSSKVDSRTIIDGSGAEKLLGRGDMLFLNSGASVSQRIHGAYVSSKEISRLTNYLREQQPVKYLEINEALRRSEVDGMKNFEDELYDAIKEFVFSVNEVSISLLQRKYRIGFNRSARIIEQLELDGVLTPSQGGKMRKVIRD